MITLIKSWLEIDQSIKCWYQTSNQSSAESEINVRSLFLQTVNHSINQSIKRWDHDQSDQIMITLIKSWLEIDQSIKCWYQSSAESEINVPSLFLRTVNHSINQSIKRSINWLIDQSWSQTFNQPIHVSSPLNSWKKTPLIRFAYHYGTLNGVGVTSCYSTFLFFLFIIFILSSTHFVHAISRNWSYPCWWNYTIIWTAMLSCAINIRMVKNGRRYHGNYKNVKKNPNFKSFVIRGKVLKVYVNVGSGAPRYQQYLEFSKWLPLPWKLNKSLSLTLWENAF